MSKASSVMPRMAFIGVRISWLTLARNRSWPGWPPRPPPWLAAPPLRRRFWSSMSMQEPNHFVTRPESSRSGSAGEMPAEAPSKATQPVLDLVEFAGRDRAGPQLETARQVSGWMVVATPIPGAVRKRFRCIRCTRVEVIVRAVRLGGPDHMRQCLGQDAEPFLALAQRLLDPLQFGDVDAAAHKSDWPTGLIADGRPPAEHPAVGPVLVAHAIVELIFLRLATEVGLQGAKTAFLGRRDARNPPRRRQGCDPRAARDRVAPETLIQLVTPVA